MSRPKPETKREAAMMMYFRRINKIGWLLESRKDFDQELVEFIELMEVPKTDDETEHKVCWQNMLMAYDRKFGEQI